MFQIPFGPATGATSIALPGALFTGESLISALTVAVAGGTLIAASNGTATSVIGGWAFVNTLRLRLLDA